jgi:hypothetical protein
MRQVAAFTKCFVLCSGALSKLCVGEERKAQSRSQSHSHHSPLYARIVLSEKEMLLETLSFKTLGFRKWKIFNKICLVTSEYLDYK